MRNLSRYCDYSERTIARQFRESFDWPDFHQLVMRAALDPLSELVSAHDASFIPKSGKQTFGLGHFFNGSASRAERGLEISTVAVVDVTRRCALTLAVAQTPPGEDGREDRAGRDRDRLLHAATALRIGIACRRASPIIVWMATVRKRNILRKLSPRSTCNHQTAERRRLRLPLYWAIPEAPWGTSANMTGKVNFQDLSRFEDLGIREDETVSASVHGRGVA